MQRLLRAGPASVVVLALALTACAGRGGPRAGEGPTTTAGAGTEADEATTTTAEASAPVRAPVRATGERVDLTVTTPDGRDRSAHLYVPDSLPDGPTALLVALHGGLGSGDQFEQSSGYSMVAEANGFLVVYPDGVGVGPGGDAIRTWNGGICCGAAARDDVDDVTFLRQLVDQIEADHDVDADRAYVTGHSNGMIMSYRLLCEAGDVFVAAAGQAGTLGVEPCVPTEPVSMLHIHGEADTNLPITGGRGAGISGVDFPSPRASIRTVAAGDGCAAEPELTVGDPLTTETWTDCDDGTTAELVSVAGASHAWMGARARTWPGGPEPFRDYDASLECWTFLAAHPRPS